jgi:glyoxylase-like metal-dependent hydrolase (beta-lactamase superfamily II)
MNRVNKLPAIGLFLIFLAAIAAHAQDLDAVAIKVYPVAGQVYYIEGRGGNIGLFVGDDGVFLIDDQFAALTDRIVDAIRTLSDKPIRFLVNTHMHPDHTGGNENFGNMGTLIFGHDNVRRQMAISEYTQEPPLVTFSEDVSFHINDETVHVFKTPDAHTNGDSYIHFTGSNVIHAGDVYRTTSYPYVDTTNGGSFLGTIEATRLLANVANEDTKIIPGHGVISNKSEVQGVAEMLTIIADRVKAAIQDGKSLEEAQAAGLTTEFDGRWDSGRRIGSAAALIEAAYADMANR